MPEPLFDITNKRVTVMGLGKFGGGIGAARFLAEHGAQVTVTDLKSAADLAESRSRLSDLAIRFVLGEHRLEDFTDTDMVVASPAVRADSPYITAAREAGVPLRTEIGLFVERCPAPICGVTGSNGKTTTVSLIAAMLDAAGVPHHVGGNIGGSLLDRLNAIPPEDRVVLELSSFQLEWLGAMNWSPHIAAVLNILPNHLDRHGTLNAYREAKALILANQRETDVAVLVRDDLGASSFADRVHGRTVWVGAGAETTGIGVQDGAIVHVEDNGLVTRIAGLDRLVIPGVHNVVNAQVAAACALEMGISHEAIESGIASFRGVIHRLEFVGEHDGIRFFNDSKATTPEAAAAGVAAFDCPVVPIFGGYDKHVPFEPLSQAVAERISWAALIGVTAPKIAEALTAVGVASETFPTLEAAFEACVGRARSGSVVVLTPGCASYDMFNDYEERGEQFRAIVNAHMADR